MRIATFVTPVGLRLPIAADPLDIIDHGEAPRHRLAGPVFQQNGARLILRGDPGDPILVRLPRRLSRVTSEDARRWIIGEPPAPRVLLLATLDLIIVEEAPRGPALGQHAKAFERRYPRRGVGYAKPLPRRRRRPTDEERQALFDYIADNLGVDYERALGTPVDTEAVRREVERAVEAAGATLTGLKIEGREVRIQVAAPVKAINFRLQVGGDIVVSEDA